jgi:tetratricopeptide (TPR) repeat protein
MPKVAQLAANDGTPAQAGADVRRIRHVRHRYYAFLSYSHKDKGTADWLHDELEGFKVPHALAGRLTEHGVIPKRLRPIFRDRHELAASDDLGEEIREALDSSHFLIVLCSPDAAKSHWTNAEIDEFKRTRPDGCVLAVIIAGEPFASDVPGRENEECFPPALRQKYDRRGRQTAKRAEPLAADLREEGDGRRTGFLKLVAGMLGVGLDELVQRDTLRRQRRLGFLVAASLGGMAVTSTLAISAIQARDAARDQRREAEGLIGFMLGDLKDKLEPVGKLDALDGVGSRVLAYYQKVGTSELTDAALTQRSRALALMGQVADSRGDLAGAERLYREAATGTQEALNRAPDDPQRMFEHAQNIFWIGELARQRGDSSGAVASAREYQRLAIKMVATDPNNMKWRIERQNADAELGIVLMSQRRFAEAARQFEGALRTIEAVAAVDPKNSEYQKSIAESLAWLADSEAAQGHLAAAIAGRRQQIALLQRLINQSDDVQYRQKMIPARQGLGRLLAATGDLAGAVGELRQGVDEADRLIPTEPNNMTWVEFAAAARIGLAEALLASGKEVEAGIQAASACAAMDRLLGRNSGAQYWRRLQRDCLAVRAAIALKAGSAADALPFASRSLALAKSTGSIDKIADRFAMAKTMRLIGDARKQTGDMAGARSAWTAALETIPRQVAERPAETYEHLVIVGRLGRKAEAGQLAARLATIGYRGFS